MALWVTGCVVMEGAVADVVVVLGEFEELLTTEMEPEASSVEAGEYLPVMVVFFPDPRELNPTQPDIVKQDHRTPRKGAESEE